MAKLVLGAQPMVAQRLGPGRYTWTLVSILGDMLAEAQALFGERDRSYTLLGIEFCGDQPRVWCPGNRKDLIIQLSLRCMDEPQQACYQLAHECIHLLGPNGCAGALVIEEGLATWFAQYYMRERIGNPNWRATLPSYLQAQAHVEALLAHDPHIIRTIRQQQPTFSAFTADLLLAHCPALGEELAAALVSPFVREPTNENESA